MASVKIAYGTPQTGTGGITSLASSANWTAGYEWVKVDNATDLVEDWFVDLVIRVGTTPTVNTEIRVYLVGSYDGTTWPDVFDGTGSAETVTSAGVRDSFAKLAGVGIVDATTSDRDYPIQFNVSSFYPNPPKSFILFVVHNSGVALNATAGNHKYSILPIYRTVA
jgi:hypothetical protein